MTLTGHVTNAAGQGDLGGNMFPIDHEVDVARCEVIGVQYGECGSHFDS